MAVNAETPAEHARLCYEYQQQRRRAWAALAPIAEKPGQDSYGVLTEADRRQIERENTHFLDACGQEAKANHWFSSSSVRDEILEHLHAAPCSLTVAEVRTRWGLPRATAYDIMYALHRAGRIERVELTSNRRGQHTYLYVAKEHLHVYDSNCTG